MQECFNFTIADWVSVSPLTPSEVNNLWDTIQAMNAVLHETLGDHEQQAAMVAKKHPKRQDVQPDGMGDETGVIEEVADQRIDVESQGRGKQTKTQSECGAMMDEANQREADTKPCSTLLHNLESPRESASITRKDWEWWGL